MAFGLFSRSTVHLKTCWLHDIPSYNNGKCRIGDASQEQAIQIFTFLD